MNHPHPDKRHRDEAATQNIINYLRLFHMDIKEYIKESLRQIVEGVKEVQSEVANKSQIAPLGSDREKVEFDIAVTVVEEQSKDKGAGLSVYCIKAGSSGQTSSSVSSVHRIKFSVNIDFESQEEKELRNKKDLIDYQQLKNTLK